MLSKHMSAAMSVATHGSTLFALPGQFTILHQYSCSLQSYDSKFHFLSNSEDVFDFSAPPGLLCGPFQRL